jgi:hypothetical protein
MKCESHLCNRRIDVDNISIRKNMLKFSHWTDSIFSKISSAILFIKSLLCRNKIIVKIIFLHLHCRLNSTLLKIHPVEFQLLLPKQVCRQRIALGTSTLDVQKAPELSQINYHRSLLPFCIIPEYPTIKIICQFYPFGSSSTCSLPSAGNFYWYLTQIFINMLF